MVRSREHAVRLLAGGSQTARLAAARKLAADAGTHLCHVDPARVLGKSIGETEKNLAVLFEHAAARGWVLCFDEADALFGRRSKVRDAHDRYANLEASYLLERMEAYPGLVLLTSNRADDMDPAAMRRLMIAVISP